SSTINRINGTATFVPKVESSFSKIQRIGNNPSTYYWVVWDKSGTKYTYMSALASSTGKKAKWYLSEIRDKNDNYIQYMYDPITYGTGSGNLVEGVETRISQIFYTLHPDFDATNTANTKLYYSVKFIYKDNSRSDANFNYRYGFKEVNASELDYIKVSCDKYGNPNTTSSSSNTVKVAVEPTITVHCDYNVEYHFNYGTGQFGKRLLNGTTTRNIQKDDNGNITATEDYTHTFDYYNDIAGGSMFGEEKTISVEDDFSDEKYSVLSASSENVKSSQVNVGAGISPSINLPSWWPFSDGGTINFAFPSSVSTQSSPTMLLLD